MVFINPKTDFAFKKIFGSKKHKSILISFLNAILYQEQDMIQDLQILNPYQAPRIQGIKESFLDIQAVITGNKTVIIEMQVLNVLGFDKRVLYNAAKAYSIQLNIGEDYTLLNPVIALTITDFEMFPDSQQLISRYVLKEKHSLTHYSDDIELVFVELPKFNKDLQHLTTLTDKWLYFLKAANTLTQVPETMAEIPAINEAFKVARQSKLTRKESEMIEQQAMLIHDQRNALALAVMQASQEAMQKGMEKGMEQGMEKGMRETAIAIARELLDVLDIETISRKTGLSVAEIRSLT